MHGRRVALSVLLSIFLLGSFASPAAASVTRTDYSAFNFPAGWPGTGTSCPGIWISTPIVSCVVGGGSIERVDGGRWVIRDLETMTYVMATSDPSLSGYMLSTLSANLDASGSGPARATWSDYSFAGELRTIGTTVGKFQAQRLDGHTVGHGVGAYAGIHLRADFLPYDTTMGNVIGELMSTPN